MTQDKGVWLHATAVSTACTTGASGMPHAETPRSLEPASGLSPALTALSQAPAQTRRCAVAVRAATRRSAWGDVQYAAAPKQHVVLDAQQVAEKRHLHASLGGLLDIGPPSAPSAPARGAGRDMSEATRAIARNVCKRAQSVAPSCRSLISAAACAGRGEARWAHRGGRTPSSRGQPVTR